MAHDDDFARHAALMESMTRPQEEPIRGDRKTRNELLRDAFTDEALRRIARKAGVESATQKGALAVNDELRSLALLMLSNLCDKAEKSLPAANRDRIIRPYCALRWNF